MTEFGDMPYRSTLFGISRLWTFDLKRVIMVLNSSNCASKTGLPDICVGDNFYMRAGALKKNCPAGHRPIPVLATTEGAKEIFDSVDSTGVIMHVSGAKSGK